ncbi:MAG: hypothetical protein EZS28_043738, partial [Streblomastix strix]
GINKAAGWVGPTLNQVLGQLPGPGSTLHPGVGAVMGIGSRLAGGVNNKTFRQLQENVKIHGMDVNKIGQYQFNVNELTNSKYYNNHYNFKYLNIHQRNIQRF